MSPEASELYAKVGQAPKWLFRSLPVGIVPLLTDAAGGAASEPLGLTVRQQSIAGRPVERIEPPDPKLGAIVYLHGGGYTTGSFRSHRRLAGHVALAASRVVLLLDYRLAPKHRYPAAVNDAVGLIEWAVSSLQGPVAVCGDSAGGGLTMAAVLSVPDRVRKLLSCIAVMSPMADLTFSAESWSSRKAQDVMLDRAAMQEHARRYLGSADPRLPTASPVFGDFTDFPPSLIQVGGAEMLLDDAVALHKALQAGGVEASLDAFPEMQHVFQMFAGRMPEADEAIRRLGEFLSSHLDR